MRLLAALGGEPADRRGERARATASTIGRGDARASCRPRNATLRDRDVAGDRRRSAISGGIHARRRIAPELRARSRSPHSSERREHRRQPARAARACDRRGCSRRASRAARRRRRSDRAASATLSYDAYVIADEDELARERALRARCPRARRRRRRAGAAATEHVERDRRGVTDRQRTAAPRSASRRRRRSAVSPGLAEIVERDREPERHVVAAAELDRERHAADARRRDRGTC